MKRIILLLAVGQISSSTLLSMNQPPSHHQPQITQPTIKLDPGSIPFKLNDIIKLPQFLTHNLEMRKRTSREIIQDIYGDSKNIAIGLSRLIATNYYLFKHWYNKFDLPIANLPLNHQWITGKSINSSSQASSSTNSSNFIWPENIAFASSPPKKALVSDQKIANLVGRYLHRRFLKALDNKKKKIPNKYPIVVDLIHGSVSYNAAMIIFNNAQDAFQYFENEQFLKDLKKIISAEKRDVLILFRDYNMGAKQLIEHEKKMNTNKSPSESDRILAGKLLTAITYLVRSKLPYFANAQGTFQGKSALGGNPAPRPLINLITNHFITDLEHFAAQKYTDLAKNSITQINAQRKKPYFETSYQLTGPYKSIFPTQSAMILIHYLNCTGQQARNNTFTYIQHYWQQLTKHDEKKQQ